MSRGVSPHSVPDGLVSRGTSIIPMPADEPMEAVVWPLRRDPDAEFGYATVKLGPINDEGIRQITDGRIYEGEKIMEITI